MGASLGKAVGDAIAQKYPNESDYFREFHKYELPSVICRRLPCRLMMVTRHSGHSGEDAIRTFFRDLTGAEKQQFTELLSENQQRDFLFFEGKANAFRTFTHSFNETNGGGFRLTYATLRPLL